MKLLFAYERLDGQYAICQVKDFTAASRAMEESNKIRISDEYQYAFEIKSQSEWATISYPDDIKEARFCSYANVSHFMEDKEPWVRLVLNEGNNQVELKLTLFNSKVIGVENSVIIRNVTEYINCVEHIRLIALAEHIISLLRYDLSTKEDPEEKVATGRFVEQLKQGVAAENHTLLHSKAALSGYRAVAANCPILKTIAEIIDSESKYTLSDSAICEIKRSLSLYQKGATFGYYRGIGRTIYPDVPSIFREANKREEDRWYRDMKTQFQNDLEKRPYLDRLGMLQHYELPTRMLDVTSSPLVALYMTSNTIYTGDASQSDIGEIVVYYDGLADETPYTHSEQSMSLDNYGSDIAYIHDGKSYDSSIVLVLASLAKLKYENKERMRKVIFTFKYLIDLGWKTDTAKYTDVMELINRCIHANANTYEKHYYFTTDELKSIRKSYGWLHPQKVICAEQICDLLWDSVKPHNFGSLPKDVFTSKDELRSEYLKCIPSYRYILSTVRRENIAFKDHINIFDLIKCFHVKTGRTNERIQAQAGSFIICGLDPDYIKNQMLSSRTTDMVRFFVDNKKAIMCELNSLGINDASMLPDMAHHAAYLKDRAKE